MRRILEGGCADPEEKASLFASYEDYAQMIEDEPEEKLQMIRIHRNLNEDAAKARAYVYYI